MRNISLLEFFGHVRDKADESKSKVKMAAVGPEVTGTDNQPLTSREILVTWVNMEQVFLPY